MNFWPTVDHSGGSAVEHVTYLGINACFTAAASRPAEGPTGGLKLEIQFHTPESLRVRVGALRRGGTACGPRAPGGGASVPAVRAPVRALRGGDDGAGVGDGVCRGCGRRGSAPCVGSGGPARRGESFSRRDQI